MGTFLNHLKERRLAQAQGLATPEFVNGEGARLLDEVLSRGFREFEVLGTEDADGAVKAIVREYWRDGIQMAAYTVVPGAARPLVAARETIN